MSASLITTLKTIFERDLNKLKVEIESYLDERNIWRTEKGIANSAGNLCLHLIGNLNTYIGAEIGKSGYIRNRQLEFSMKNVPVSELLHQIKRSKEIVISSLENLTDKDLEKEYPILVFDKKTSVGYFLVHLTTHLTYHLGQINYHRRLIDVT